MHIIHNTYIYIIIYIYMYIFIYIYIHAFLYALFRNYCDIRNTHWSRKNVHKIIFVLF